MATYGIKYYAEFRNYKGQDYRLVIMRRGYSGSSTKIGTLSGCVLEVQGNMGDIIAPIIKTQLRFTLIDAPDMPAVSGTKFGDWQEFFTPDATLYKVVFRYYVNNDWQTIWTGYITPDSWVESLEYRGAITITARDNIGHLQDFPFSAEGDATPDSNGLVQIRYIISQAMKVIDFPMTFAMESWGSGQYSADVPCTADDDYVTEAYVNASLFEGMNWYEVLEQTLEAIGFVLRFVGNEKFVACSLRNLPKLGNYSSATGSQALVFHGGTLELDPAVKQIREEVDYGSQTEVTFEIMKGLAFGGDAADYRCRTYGNTLPGGGTVSSLEHDAPRDYLTSVGQTVWINGRDLLNPADYLPDDFLKRSEGDNWKNYAFIPGNRVSDAVLGTSVQFASRTAAAKLTFRFTPHALTINNSGSMSGKMSDDYYALASIRYRVSYSSTDHQTTRWWNGYSWANTSEILEKTFDSQNQYETDFVIELGECEDVNPGYLEVEFVNITYKCWSSVGKGAYARVVDLSGEVIAQQMLKGNIVTTINNSAYNVKIERRPVFNPLSIVMGFLTPQNYMRGMFNYTAGESVPSLFPYLVRFTDQNDGALVPFPVLVHEQILCYYYGAARVLNGSCQVVGNAQFMFNKLNTYKGHTYLFQGGTLDYFSGIINNACFREFVNYSELWDGTPPSYDSDVEYNR